MTTYEFCTLCIILLLAGWGLASILSKLFRRAKIYILTCNTPSMPQAAQPSHDNKQQSRKHHANRQGTATLNSPGDNFKITNNDQRKPDRITSHFVTSINNCLDQLITNDTANVERIRDLVDGLGELGQIRVMHLKEARMTHRVDLDMIKKLEEEIEGKVEVVSAGNEGDAAGEKEERAFERKGEEDIEDGKAARV